MNKKNLYFFIAVFVLGILPHLHFIPLDVTASGRWFYIAAFGLLGALGVVLKDRYIYFLIIPIIIFSLITVRRTFDFRDGYSLYVHDIQFDQNNYNLENNLGVEYFRMGSIDKAGYHFQKSVDLNPIWWTNYNNLGVYYERLGSYDKALEMYDQAIKNGQYYLAYENYAKILVRQNKLKEAELFIEDALKIFPQNITLKYLIESMKNQ